LTRYAFGWLIIPVLIYMGAVLATRRMKLLLITLGIFLAVVSPWVARNVEVSGTPFGTAGFAVYENTFLFPEYNLQRSLDPSFRKLGLRPFGYKLVAGSREILQNDLPKLGGGWVSALFLTGLLLGQRSPALRRLRYFLLGTLLTFIIVQSLGRTQLSVDSPVLNGENLLVLTVPLVFLFGTGLFLQLLDQIGFAPLSLRSGFISLFAIVACLPMLYSLLPPKSEPMAFPTCNPQVIQRVCGWMQEDELMMSDIPWAVAWYGNRQCAWLTQNAQSEFFAINDFLKPVRALYLTPETMDNRFLSQWVRAGDHGWGNLILNFMLTKKVSEKFPLRAAAPGFLPEQLFLTDWERWKTTPPGRVAPVLEKKTDTPDGPASETPEKPEEQTGRDTP
jgi:hypothetical protein